MKANIPQQSHLAWPAQADAGEDLRDRALGWKRWGLGPDPATTRLARAHIFTH